MSKYKIGDIVSVNSHPYFKDLTNINISGEPINVIPLMVVIEIYNETRTSYNEETGEKLSLKGDGKCKCMWFSLKSNAFSEAWFNFDSLKIISRKDAFIQNNSGLNSIEFRKRLLEEYANKDVIFTTSTLELEKIKETKLHDKKNDKISECNSLLNFVAPPLQIIDVKLEEDKPIGKFDSKSGDRKRINTEIFFKCRYYNALADKWTEVLLPNECFELLENVETILREIDEDKKKGFYLYDYTQEKNYDPSKKEESSLLEIGEVTYVNGRYSLKTYDLIHQEWKVLDIPFDGVMDIKSKEEIYYNEVYPNFDFRKGDRALDPEKLLGELLAFVDKFSDENSYLMVTYLNGSDKLVRRVLKNAFVVLGATKKASNYLHGFCCKKREMRSFNFDKIKSVRALKF
ncbi:WYL domain-containing protein [Sphingobacterium thalpophilum]|uniref:Uncharacterized protein n=1 Tax=Sphingobacterium thalpophilum TaxID=259 RepID=A0A4U9VV95_9SPHI|nr:hypothetical protein [Sphingobacterium thalpophilum]VTR51486.1 Uncharacterised protein [Sphingobacterium thalpophilum]